MTAEFSAAENFLLHCCANPDASQTNTADLIEGDADELVALALRTRTFAIVARSAAKAADRNPAFCAASDRLAQLARRQALHSLEQARAIAQVVCDLERAGFAAIALKGAALSYSAYPGPHMRPLRDLDLLLPAAQALEAERLLLSMPAYRRASWAGNYGLEYSHQLPEIEHIGSGLAIEIHHRINARGWLHDVDLVNLLNHDTQSIELLGQKIRVPNAGANLLHLVEHASLHHSFANGPLTLADIHFLDQHAALDWDWIWREAQRLGLGRALALLAEMGRSLGAKWPINLPRQVTGEVSEHVAPAIRAMLATPQLVEQHGQQRRLSRRRAGGNVGMAALSRIFRPDRYQLAQLSGRSADSALRWLGYPTWLLEKGALYLRGRRDMRQTGEYQERDHLIDWLAG